MSADEARSILGVGPEATPEEVQAAYTRLMRLAHPDKGGTSGLAAQLNAARDRLIRK
jgi:curved DNA-binding protein CbpA